VQNDRIGSHLVRRIVEPAVLIAVLLALMFLAERGIGWAQLPATNPLVVPPLPPSPPAQLPAPVTTAIAPAPLSISTMPAAYSTPGPRVFNCSCFGPRQAVAWMGQVTSSGYYAAAQAAGSACATHVSQSNQSANLGAIAGAANNYPGLPGSSQKVNGTNNSGSVSGTGGAGAANNYGGLVGTTQNPGAANNYPALPRAFNSSATSCTYCACD
jgi:hypothetical protein